MDKNLFEKIDPMVDEIATELDAILASDALAALKQKLAVASKLLAPYSLSLDVNLCVFDENRDSTLPLLQTGLATSAGAEPHQVWGDSTPQRYVVHGEMMTVPHDRCPRCWGLWDFKSTNPACELCSAEMGEDVKLLIDSDICPHCEQGQITASHPTCNRCGFHVDPAHVVWG